MHGQQNFKKKIKKPTSGFECSWLNMDLMTNEENSAFQKLLNRY